MNLLGEQSPVPQRYAPDILHPIPRADGRRVLAPEVDFHGEDLWHAWELSWLDPEDRPQVAVGRFAFPADTANIVESKSFKLYLNSLNQWQFASVDALRATLASDLSVAAGGPVQVDVLSVDDPGLAPTSLPGVCVDDAPLESAAKEPSAAMLRVSPAVGEVQVLYSHALRSLCPVTAQPDWASVVLRTREVNIEPQSLLSYILGFRQHQEFHEQCVERMFCDLLAAGLVDFDIQALYTRRGGLDISPWRSTAPGQAPRLRTLRQ